MLRIALKEAMLAFPSRWKPASAIAPLVIAVAMLAACRRPEEEVPLDEARRRVAAIELCKTREQEAISSFGEPMRDGRSGRLRVRSWLLAPNGIERILAVALDERGTVVDVCWDVPEIVTWVPRDQCAPAAAATPGP